MLQQLPTSRLPAVCGGPGLILWNMLRERASDAVELYGVLLQLLIVAVTDRPVVRHLAVDCLGAKLACALVPGCLTGLNRSQTCIHCL